MNPRGRQSTRHGRALAGLLGVALLAFAGGCTTSNRSQRHVVPNPQDEQSRLFQTDIEFSRVAAQLGVAQAFYLFFTDDAVWLPVGMQPILGRQAIRDTLQQAGAVKLSWQPQMAAVALSRDLGYTWGLYEARVQAPDGTERVIRGKYTTVWRKQPDDSWKVVVHAGNTNEP